MRHFKKDLHGEKRRKPRRVADPRTFASIDGKTVVVRNISVGGIAIVASGLTFGSTHLLELNMNGQHLASVIRIVADSEHGTLHACFVDPADRLRAVLRDTTAA